MSGGAQDLPGYSRNYEIEKKAILEVEAHLVDLGFKYMEVEGTFDDGIDLMVAPHDEHNVLPAIAGVQVRGRSAGSTIAVERHGRYWAELNMPVFGILATSADTRWNDLGCFLQAHPNATTIPADRPFDETFGFALRDASNKFSAKLAVVALGNINSGRDQATAVTMLRTMHDDAAVAVLLRCALPALQPVACRLALNHLALLPTNVRWTPPLDPYVIHSVLTHLHEFHFDDAPGNDQEEVLFDGAQHLLDLINTSGTDAITVAEAGLLAWDSEVAYAALHLAICRASSEPGLPNRVLRHFLRLKPEMRDHRDVQEIIMDWREDEDWIGFDSIR